MKVFVSGRMDDRKVYSDQYSTTNYGSTGNNCHVANRCEHDETRLSTNVTSNGDAETKQPLRGDADMPDVEVHPNNNEADVEETEQDMGNLFLLLARALHFRCVNDVFRLARADAHLFGGHVTLILPLDVSHFDGLLVAEGKQAAHHEHVT